MKIHAQASVPSKMPYAHLGYLAATSMSFKEHFWIPGLLLLVAAVVLGIELVRRVLFRRNEKRRLVLVFGLAGGAGVIATSLLFFTFATRSVTYDHPDEATNKLVDEAGEALVSHLLGLTDAQRCDPGAALQGFSPYTDGWANPMRVDNELHERDRLFAFVSAGADAQFGTADDIRGAPIVVGCGEEKAGVRRLDRP